MHQRDKTQNSFSISIFIMVNTIVDIVCHIFKHPIYEFNQVNKNLRLCHMYFRLQK